jgi:hypothetical protein
MNSKQLNFFISDEDRGAVNDFLKEQGCILIRNNVKEIPEAFIGSIDELHHPKATIVYFTNVYYKPDVVFKHQNVQNVYYVDIDTSPVLQFTLGGSPFKKSELERGRLYFFTKNLVNGEWVSKDEPFIKWCDDIMKKFKKRFLKNTVLDKSIYFTENAVKWYHDNSAKVSGGSLKLIAK